MAGARAGVAYVDVRPDFSSLNRGLSNPALGRQFNQLGGQLGGMLTRGLTVATKAGAVGVAGGLIFAVKKAADFEGQLSSLGAVSDANAKQMERFRKAAMKAGADTKFSALEAAEAQTELAKGGLKVAQIMRGGLKSSLALAAAGQLELGEAAETTVTAMKLFGLRGKASMKIADGLATAANKTTADVSDFSIAFKMGGSAAKAAGLNFRETTGALEALAEIGIKGSDAGTSLKAMLMQLANPTKKAREEMDRLGLEVFDAHGNMLALPKVAAEFRRELGPMNREQRLAAAGTLVGSDGMRAMLALYDAGPRKIQRFLADLSKQGTAADVARKKQDNLKGSLEQLGGSFETLGIGLGTMAIPAIRTGADELTGFTNKLNRISQRDDLDIAEKLQKSFDLAKVEAGPWIDKLEGAVDRADLPGKLGDAISAATPVIAEAAAGAAGVGVTAFVRSWGESNVWGRLAMGGFLLAKLGGPAAFRRAGRKAGAEMAAGMAGVGAVGGAAAGGIGAVLGARMASQTVQWVKGPGGGMVAQIGTATGKGMAPAIAPAIAGSGLKGRLAGMFRGWGPLLAGSIALTFGPELVKLTKEHLEPKTERGLPKTGDLVSRLMRNPFTDDEQRLRAFGDTAEQLFAKLDRAGNITGLEKLAADARELAKDFPRSADALRRFAADVDSIAKPARRVENLIGQMERGSSQSIESLRAKVKLNTSRIRKALADDPEAGKKALSRSFAAAAENVRRSMREGTIATEAGTAEIERLMVLALQNMGFSKQQALRVRAGQDPVSGKAIGGKQNLTGKQRGGPLADGGMVVPGSGTGDKVHLEALVEPGERVFVLNRNASKRLAALQRLNAAVPRFQGGGLVPKGGFPDAMGALPGLDALGWILNRKFGLGVTSGLRPGAITTSGNPSDHGWGGAVDVSNGRATPQMDAANAWMDDRIAPAIKQKLYRTLIGGDHFSHIHVALQRAFAMSAARVVQLAKIVAPNLPRVRVDGPDSLLKSVVQGTLDTTGAGAQARLDGLAGFQRGGLVGAQLGHLFQPGWAGGAAAPRLGGQLNRVLRTVRGRRPRRRSKAISGLLEKIRDIGLPASIEADLRKHGSDEQVFGQRADMASRLNVDSEDGTTILGQVFGGTEIDWLGQQLEALFRLRNTIIRAEEIVVARREETTKLITEARKKLHNVRTAIGLAAGIRKGLASQLETARKHPKRNKALIKTLRGKIEALDGEQRPRFRVRDALKDRILPTLTGQRTKLNDRRGDLLSKLEEIQGVGSSMSQLAALPGLGTLGGQIFDVQMRLRDLQAPKPAVTDPDAGPAEESPSAAALAELLREANLRTAVSQAQYAVLRNFPPFGGSFASGGVVPGPVGAPRTIIAHGGETVTPEGGAGGRLRVVIEDHRVRVFENDIEIAVEQVTRHQARAGGRRMPGRPGALA